MSTLSPEERRRRILNRLREGTARIEALAREMGVSAITARRDLDRLEREGKVLRVRGGAMVNERVAYEFSFREKEARHRPEKEAIARAAARLVKPGAAVFLDGGTTSLAVARRLRAARPGVIVTVNLCVASEYVGQEGVQVLVPGGELGRRSPDVLGEWTLATLAGVSVDLAFLGCDSVEPEDGFYSADSKSAAVCRLMLERSRRAYLLADSSKFGNRSLCRIAPLDRLAGIVTDSRIEARWRKAVRKAGTELITGDLQ